MPKFTVYLTDKRVCRLEARDHNHARSIIRASFPEATISCVEQVVLTEDAGEMIKRFDELEFDPEAWDNAQEDTVDALHNMMYG